MAGGQQGREERTYRPKTSRAAQAIRRRQAGPRKVSRRVRVFAANPRLLGEGLEKAIKKWGARVMLAISTRRRRHMWHMRSKDLICSIPPHAPLCCALSKRAAKNRQPGTCVEQAFMRLRGPCAACTGHPQGDSGGGLEVILVPLQIGIGGTRPTCPTPGRLGRGIYYSYSYGDKRRVTKRLLHPLDIYRYETFGRSA